MRRNPFVAGIIVNGLAILATLGCLPFLFGFSNSAYWAFDTNRTLVLLFCVVGVLIVAIGPIFGMVLSIVGRLRPIAIAMGLMSMASLFGFFAWLRRFGIGPLALLALSACSKKEPAPAPLATASTTSPAVELPFEKPHAVLDHPPALSPSATPLERARSAYLSGDIAGARTILEPRVLGGRTASEEETKFLLEICGKQKDQQCLDKVHQVHP